MASRKFKRRLCGAPRPEVADLPGGRWTRAQIFDWLAGSRATTAIDELVLTNARWHGSSPGAIAELVASLERIGGGRVRVVTASKEEPRRRRRRR
jgi:hypothetical protein